MIRHEGTERTLDPACDAMALRAMFDRAGIDLTFQWQVTHNDEPTSSFVAYTEQRPGFLNRQSLYLCHVFNEQGNLLRIQMSN